MRSIYSEAKYGIIDQGLIFNAAVADGYNNREVFGIIISPRCDIQHRKNEDIYYLPIVSLTDWFSCDGKNIFVDKCNDIYISKLKSELQKYSISLSILHNNSFAEQVNIIKQLVPEAQKHKQSIDLIGFLEELELLKFNKLNSSKVKDLFIREAKQVKTIVKELSENKKKEYYLIEPFLNTTITVEELHHVILNRQIKKVEYELAVRITNGYVPDNDSKIQYPQSEVNFNDKNNFIVTLKTLKSPYIEHVMQQFMSNFNRIGVTDHTKDLHETLITKINYDKIFIH
jgi:hypothetical protein